jgi:hypothetical protein
MAAHWLTCRAQPQKKQVHLGWEYSGLEDLTRGTLENITLELLVKHLGEIFQDTSSWPTDEQVRSYHIRVERDPIRCFDQFSLFYFLKISLLRTASFHPSPALREAFRSQLSQYRPDLLVARLSMTPPSEPMPVHQKLGLASGKQLQNWLL